MPPTVFNDDMEPTPPQTEDAAERGFVEREEEADDPVTYRDRGESEELGGGTAGDIADEGSAHRG